VDPFLLAPRVDGDANNPPRFGTLRGERDVSRFRISGGQAGTAAGSTGFDSRNLGKRKKTAQTKKPAGTTPAKPTDTANNDAAINTSDAPAKASPKLLQPRSAAFSAQTGNPFRPGAPPATTDAETATVASVAPYWRPLPEERPFSPLGIQTGAFNFRPALEYVRGYDTNPGRLNVRPYASSWYNIYAPSLLVNTNWDRHAFNADFVGAYYSYDTYHPLDRPSAGRLIVATERPGSPFIQADLARLPVYTTLGGGVGFGQKFNRLEVIVKGDVDTTKYLALRHRADRNQCRPRSHAI
jgi:hypothetical protein